MSETVIPFLRANGRVLLVRRGTADGEWDVPVRNGEEGFEGTARELAREWLPDGEATLVRAGDPVEVDDRRLHPFLFDCEPNGVGKRADWVHPTALRHDGPPGRWQAYRAVSPSVGSVRDDRTHGSAYLSIRALEVLRDRAAQGADPPALVERATDLLEARPSMAALGNRVNRAMFEAGGSKGAAALEDAAKAGIDRAAGADRRAAERAAELIEGIVLTLSRSGTVRGALSAGEPDRIVVLESRPDREGADVAEELAGSLDVTVTLDAAVSHVMPEVDHVLVGADTVLADGSVINKVGTRTTAVVAAREGVPVHAVAAVDKVSPSESPILESVDRGALTDDDRVGVDCPLFDRTPPELVAGVITEEGVLDADGIEAAASDHERRSRWKGSNGSTG
ncbi:initiation factor 2B-like protein [Halalkalicoccus tibetensis]|uniref:Initiation factor 2B-like protein n=1 Tax=Halalkalicoccus tibetensis TaxID=175632 RepID=A0ABD5V144_9EURY